MFILLARTGHRTLHQTRRLEKVVPFLLADIGEGIKEVEVLQWLVQEGNKVRQFDKIAEVQSDKATVEITSRYDGVIRKIHYTKGATASVGSPLVDIEVEGDEEVHAPSSPLATARDATAKTGHESGLTETVAQLRHATMGAPSVTVKAMPGVRHLARTNGVDISQVQATGRSGQILKEDVIAYLDHLKGPSNSLHITSIPKIISDPAGYTAVPLNAFQRAMVKNMQAALTIPHFGFHDEVNVNILNELRKSLSSASETKYAVRLTMICFFIKALSLALTDYPILNAHYDNTKQQLKHFAAHNIGIAVDTEHGLAVPVIKAVQDLSIVDVARELSRLTAAARENKLSNADLSHGTFTLSNIGSIGGTTASPIIVVPQVCILALGRTQLLPRFDENKNVVERAVMPVSYSADHRVIDGATVARFSQRWRTLIQDPSSLLLHLAQP